MLVGALPRLLLAGGALPTWLSPFVWSDVLYTWQRGLSGGRLPYWGAYFEYPPLDGYLAGLFLAITTNALAYVALWTAVQIAAAVAVGAALPLSGRRRWIAWALAPQLALFGSINFDLIAVAALVIALRADRARAPLRAVVALAVGTAAKLYPLITLPVLLLRRGLAGRMVAAQVAVFGVVLSAWYAPAAIAPFSSLASLTRYSVEVRANFDSFWGLLAKALDGIGVPSALPVLLITSTGLAITYLGVVVPAARSSSDRQAPAALAVVTLLLWSRLYSPQYSLWVLPFFALVDIPLRWLLVLTTADTAVFMTVYPLGLVHWSSPNDPVGTTLIALLAAAVALRQVALAGIWLAVRRVTLRPTAAPAQAAVPPSAAQAPRAGR